MVPGTAFKAFLNLVCACVSGPITYHPLSASLHRTFAPDTGQPHTSGPLLLMFLYLECSFSFLLILQGPWEAITPSSTQLTPHSFVS